MFSDLGWVTYSILIYFEPKKVEIHSEILIWGFLQFFLSCVRYILCGDALRKTLILIYRNLLKLCWIISYTGFIHLLPGFSTKDEISMTTLYCGLLFTHLLSRYCFQCKNDKIFQFYIKNTILNIIKNNMKYIVLCY